MVSSTVDGPLHLYPLRAEENVLMATYSPIRVCTKTYQLVIERRKLGYILINSSNLY